MRAGRDPVRLAVVHERPEDRGVHPRAQIARCRRPTRRCGPRRGSRSPGPTCRRTSARRRAGRRACRRFASSTIAFEPAPPATAPLTASTPGFDARNAAKRASRAAASDPEVHHDTTSSCFVLVVALVGASPPHAPERQRERRDGRDRREAPAGGHAAPPAGRAGRAGQATDAASRTGSPPITLGSALRS